MKFKIVSLKNDNGIKLTGNTFLDPEGTISDILFNSGDFFEFYAPTFSIEELLRHK